jgi:hypothetical protein
MLMIGFLFALTMAHLAISLVVMKHPIRILGSMMFGF